MTNGEGVALQLLIAGLEQGASNQGREEELQKVLQLSLLDK